MKIQKLLGLGTLVTVLCMAGSAFAVSLSDDLLADATHYKIGDTVYYTVSLEAQGGDLTDVEVYFYVPRTVVFGSCLGIDEAPGGVKIAGPMTLFDGVPVVLDYLDDPALAYEIQPGDFTDSDGAALTAKLATVASDAGEQDCDAETKTVTIVPPPCLEVTKTVNCDEATVGATVTYTYTLHNCGDNALDITAVTDTVVPDADVAAALVAAGCDPLAADDGLPGGDDECTFTVDYTIKATDPDPLVNLVHVDAIDDFGQTVYGEATATVDILTPCLLLEKSCTSIDPVEKGGVAFFRISLTNCGDLPLLIDTTDIDDPDCDGFDGILVAGAGPVTCDLSIDIPADFTGTEFINHVMAEWSTIPSLPCVILIEDTENAQAPCEVTGGATRTPGFWKTHTDFAEHVLLTHCGGVLDLGFVELDSIDEICAYFWANKANNSDGSKRTKLCQARMHAAFHAIAALLNNCVPSGGGIPVDPAEIATILGGTDIDAIHELAGILAAYNESGDDVALIDPDASPGSATPQECRAYDQSIADCESLPKPGKGPK